MANGIKEEISRIIVCPDCGGGLGPQNGRLACEICGADYKIVDGIPLLYPSDLDSSRLYEEKKLGDIMKDLDPKDKDAFSEREWESSKREFWDTAVEKCSSIREGVLANIGCGIDRGFERLKGEGRTLIGFDLMPDLLMYLRDELGIADGVAGAVHALPFRNGSFDCICCVDLIHHEWRRIGEILASFFRALKPGGVLLLEDINAWAVFQFYKSILLPKPVHGRLRTIYHRARRSGGGPAEYEFPTSVFEAGRLLEKTGFENIEAIPLRSYPNIGSVRKSIYDALAASSRIRTYHNFHYMYTAVKPAAD